MINKFFISLSLFLVALTCRASGTEINQDNAINFLMPIDHVSSQKYSVYFSIPKNFKSIQPASMWENLTTIEFIPQNENANNWSEIITIQKRIGQKMQASQFTNLMYKHFQKIVPYLNVWNKSTLKLQIQASTLGLLYTYQGKIEVVGMNYFSGPYDCVGIQYTIRIPNKKSDQQAKNKILEFFKEKIKVVQF